MTDPDYKPDYEEICRQVHEALPRRFRGPYHETILMGVRRLVAVYETQQQALDEIRSVMESKDS